MERYDLADLVRLIATVWPEDRIEGYAPTYPQQLALETGMEGALRTLIKLATLRGWGEAALDDYLAEHGSGEDDDETPETEDGHHPRARGRS